MRRAAKRDASEPEIVAALKQCGFSVVRMDRPVDLLVGVPGRKGPRQMFLVECKTGTKGYGKTLNENQSEFAASWRGPEIVILRSAQDAVDWAVEVASGMEKAA